MEERFLQKKSLPQHFLHQLSFLCTWVFNPSVPDPRPAWWACRTGRPCGRTGPAWRGRPNTSWPPWSARWSGRGAGGDHRGTCGGARKKLSYKTIFIFTKPINLAAAVAVTETATATAETAATTTAATATATKKRNNFFVIFACLESALLIASKEK